MTTEEIKQGLLIGKSFGNHSANWYSLVNIQSNVFIISINNKFRFYKNIDSVSKRIMQLCNRGY